MSNRNFMFLAFVLSSLIGMAPASRAGESGDWVVSLALNHLEPREDQDWQSATGGELQLQKWIGKEIGFALTVGQENWEMNRFNKSSGATGIFFDAELTGETDFTTVGGAMLWRAPINKARTFMMNIEFGVQFVHADPDAELKVRATAAGSGATGTFRSDLDGDSGTNTRLVVDVARRFDNGFEIFAGIGYQWNIGKVKIDGSVDAFGTRLSAGEIRGASELTLDAMMGRIGVRKRF